MPKVSVVVPVYNVEKYLRECLDSIINQTLKDIEIICVDDGSTDSSAQVLDEYAEKDKRIKVIHKTNSGYGHTMNIGMDNAKGEYIGVVESDDCILPDMYEILYNKAKEYNLDIVKSDFYYWWSIYDYSYIHHQPYLNNLYNKVIEDKDLDKVWSFAIFTWTGIYRKEFLTSNNIRHNETAGASYQDAGFRAQVMSQIKRAMWLDKAFYMYRQDNPASSMKSKEKMMCIYNEYQFIKKILLDKKLVRQWKYSNLYRLGGMFATLYRIDDKLKREYLDILKEDYLTYKDDILCNDIDKNWSLQMFEKMDMIIDNSDKFLNDYYKQKELFIRRLKNNIIIYGTGKVANSVFLRLLSLNLDDKILFFAETNPQNKNKFVKFDIKPAQEITKYTDDTLVIVAVGKTTGAYDEVVANLERLGIKNYSNTEFLWENVQL